MEQTATAAPQAPPMQPRQGWQSMLSRRLRTSARALRRTLGLSPMQAVIREISRRGVNVRQARALECFAFDGHMHTIDYARKVRTLEVWEINRVHEPGLRQTFPQATVRIVDSYKEAERCTGEYDIIVVDNSPVHGKHVEHFDLFPGIFRLAAGTCVLVLDVIPEYTRAVGEYYADMYDERAQSARQRFYAADDARHIPLDQMVRAYVRAAAAAGFAVQWSFSRKRNDIITYLVLLLTKTS